MRCPRRDCCAQSCLRHSQYSIPRLLARALPSLAISNVFIRFPLGRAASHAAPPNNQARRGLAPGRRILAPTWHTQNQPRRCGSAPKVYIAPAWCNIHAWISTFSMTPPFAEGCYSAGGGQAVFFLDKNGQLQTRMDKMDNRKQS